MMNRILFFDIDTQFDFINSKGALYVDNAESIVPNLLRLNNFISINKHYIISSVDNHDIDDPELFDLPAHCIAGTPGQLKIKETRQNNPLILSEKRQNINIKSNHAFIIEKNCFDLFSNPNTDVLLDLIRPEESIVYGVATDYCVKFAVLGLVKRKYSVTLITDAIKGINESDAQKFLDQSRKMGVKLITTNELLEGLK